MADVQYLVPVLNDEESAAIAQRCADNRTSTVILEHFARYGMLAWPTLEKFCDQHGGSSRTAMATISRQLRYIESVSNRTDPDHEHFSFSVWNHYLQTYFIPYDTMKGLERYFGQTD